MYDEHCRLIVRLLRCLIAITEKNCSPFNVSHQTEILAKI